jgi:hypothetical protein
VLQTTFKVAQSTSTVAVAVATAVEIDSTNLLHDFKNISFFSLSLLFYLRFFSSCAHAILLINSSFLFFSLIPLNRNALHKQTRKKKKKRKENGF